jgi:hypothetical protein
MRKTLRAHHWWSKGWHMIAGGANLVLDLHSQEFRVALRLCYTPSQIDQSLESQKIFLRVYRYSFKHKVSWSTQTPAVKLRRENLS